MAAAVDRIGGIARARRNCRVAPPVPPIPAPPVVVVPPPPVAPAPGAPPAAAAAATVDATPATAASASPPSGEEPEGNSTAEACKAEGNEHFKAGRYEQAVSLYTEAIGHDPTNAALFSNRCVLNVVAVCYVFLLVEEGGVEERKRQSVEGTWLRVRDGGGAMALMERGWLLAGSAAWRADAWGNDRDESHRRV